MNASQYRSIVNSVELHTTYWVVSIQATNDNADCFNLFIEGVESRFDEETKKHTFPIVRHCYQITAEMEGSSILKINKVSTLQNPEDNQLISTYALVSMEQGNRIITAVTEIQTALSSPDNNVSYNLENKHSSKLLDQHGDEEIDQEYLTHRNDQYISLELRLKELYEMSTFLFYCYRVVEPTSTPAKQISGMFHPLSNLWQDIQNTVTPYHSNEQRNENLLQPFHGIIHILLGIGAFSWGLIELLPVFIIAAASLKLESFKQLAYPVSSIIEGIGNTLYGSLQIITSPFLLITVPLRSLLTSSSAEEKQASTDNEKRILTTAAILKKIKNNIKDCQDINEEKIQEIYQDCQTVSNLLAEIELDTEKFKYRLNKADGLKYKNTVVSPFFTRVGANHNLERGMLAKNLINQSVKYPNVPLIPALSRAHQILHKPLPSLQDIEEVERLLDNAMKPNHK